MPSQDRPRIVSTQQGTPYLVRRDAPDEYQKIPLIARVSPYTEKLYWYQDGLLIGTPEAHQQLFISLQPGSHRLVVVDNLGLSDSVIYQVWEPQSH